MEFWFYEQNTKSVNLGIKIKEHLYSEKSEFQKIDVMDSIEFGRMLVLDGVLMLTEKDEFIYHEMIVHVPMCYKPDAKKVLVIGGGDGGTVKELVKYKGLELIDLVDIDKSVVEVSKKFFPELTSGLTDKRVNIFYEDGLRFVRKHKKKYDLIIVDSTDPFGPGEGLFTREFYGNCFNALTEDGLLVNQHESPFYEVYREIMAKMHERLKAFFPFAKVYQAHIPTYPSGHWLFGLASKKEMCVDDIKAAEWKSQGISTRYYNTSLHLGAFSLPEYVKEIFRAEGKK